MHLSPRDIDKLLLHQAGFLAQKRLARGVRLNAPETIALIATQVMEFARDGRTVSDVMQLGRTLLGYQDVMNGIAAMVHEVQVEATFPDGTKLVTVHDPICREYGDRQLALYGSFLPTLAPTSLHEQADESTMIPGEFLLSSQSIVLNEERETRVVLVKHCGDRPIQVGSHYPFESVNGALQFDREHVIGFRLDIPAGSAIRFEPGEERTVRLVKKVATSECAQSEVMS